MPFVYGIDALFSRLVWSLRLMLLATVAILSAHLPAAADLLEPGTLADARKAYKTTLTRKVSAKDVPPRPPQGVFDLVRYKSPVGELAAYVTPDPKDGVRRPAIVWITGGVCNTIGDVWTEAPPENDQTASAYRQAGIVMMFPSLRGGNEGRGFQEGFYGEVDDVVAAANHLAKLPYVDPDRIYLGGHSTGGTLALLVGMCTNRFRAVISFGPATGVLGYRRSGLELPFGTGDLRELKLRSPLFWMDDLQSPTYVLEGMDQPSNVDDLEGLAAQRGKSTVTRCVRVKGVDHFSILAPANKVFAGKILADKGERASLDLTAEDLNAISPGAGEARGAVLPMPVPTVGPVQPAVPGRGPGASRRRDGEIEWTRLVGSKGDQMIQVGVGNTDRMTGLVFEMTDAGHIRMVAPASLIQGMPREKPNQKVVTGRAGYVLHGVHVDAKERVNAIRLVFVRLKNDGRIAPEDTYESDWVGTPTGDKPVTLGCDGKKVAGFMRATRGEVLSGFGLALTERSMDR